LFVTWLRLAYPREISSIRAASVLPGDTATATLVQVKLLKFMLDD
jgi:hypothetical protein